MKVIAFIKAVTFKNHDNQTVGAQKRVNEWLRQWTAPNNFKAAMIDVAPEFEQAKITDLIQASPQFKEWLQELHRMLRSMDVLDRGISMSDFVLVIGASKVTEPNGSFWISGDVTYNLILEN